MDRRGIGVLMASLGRRRPGRWVAPALLAATIGCQEYDWRTDYAQAEQEACQQGKNLFVFYKYWLDPASNRMLNEELSEPGVKAQFQDTINVMLDKDYGPPYVEYVRKYGVSSWPASIIVAPDGRFEVKFGRIPKDQLIEWAKKAKAAPGSASGRKSEPPAPAPR